MKLLKPLSILSIIGVVLSHSPPGNHAINTNLNELEGFSLPNLVKVNTIDELSNNWEKLENSDFKEGRIILTPKPEGVVSRDDESIINGAIWSLHSLTNLKEFTIEVTLRSLGSYGPTGSGMNVFLIDDNIQLNNENMNNFGGPNQFKGVQILFNNDLKMGANVKVFFNDGTKIIDVNDEGYLGAYLYEYQDSNVPLTLKIAYSSINKYWLKMTVDNKLLFETDQIDLTQILEGGARLGVTGSTPKILNKHEQFEILRLKSYLMVTEDMKLPSKETLHAKHVIEGNDNELSSPPPLSSSSSIETGDQAIFETIKNKVDEIYKQLGSMGANNNEEFNIEILKLTKSLEELNVNLNSVVENVRELNFKYDSISEMFKRQFELMDSYDRRMGSFDKVLKTQLDSSERLDTKISDWVKKNPTNNDHEFNLKESSNDNSKSISGSIITILILVIILLLVLALLVFKLRNDIKHAKVL